MPDAALAQAEGAPELIRFWRTPVFREKLYNVPAFMLPRLSEMATEVPDTHLGRRIYYERVHALLAVEGKARALVPLTCRAGRSSRRVLYRAPCAL